MNSQQHPEKLPGQGILAALRRATTKMHTSWLRATYPFARFGEGVSIHHRCEVSRAAAQQISLGDNLFIGTDVWLNVVLQSKSDGPKIVLGRGCKIGRRSTISAKNFVELRNDVLLAPSVLIMDHNHEYSDPTLPIHAQGCSEGGRIVIEENCWLGHGSVISCGKGELVLGRNSVVGANSVVTKSFPPFSVIAGNPAKLVRRFDEISGKWIRVSEESNDKFHVNATY